MSIADHFEHAPNTGFVRDYDSGSARRQFNVSLVLVAVIVLAASALGFVIRFDAPWKASDSSVANQMGPSEPPPAYAGRL